MKEAEVIIGLGSFLLGIFSALLVEQRRDNKFQKELFDKVLHLQESFFSQCILLSKNVEKNTADIKRAGDIIQREVFDRYYKENQTTSEVIDSLQLDMNTLEVRFENIEKYFHPIEQIVGKKKE